MSFLGSSVTGTTKMDIELFGSKGKKEIKRWLIGVESCSHERRNGRRKAGDV